MVNLQNTSYFLWQPAACLRVTGEDALTFLQGQVTNNLAKLIPGGAVYGLLLNQKGKVVADVFVTGTGESEFQLVSYHSPATVIRERLEAYIIADDVTIHDETDAWRGITCFTEAPRDELLAQLPGEVTFRGRRGVAAHWELLIRPEVRSSVVTQLTPALAVSEQEIERRRIAAAIPAIPQDIGSGELPNEGSLEEIAISYTKGCYLGQEVMARLKSMGQVRRKLMRLSGEAAMPDLPAPLFAGGKRVGELRSAVTTPEGFDGLALVTLMHVPADGKLALAADGPAVVALRTPA